MNSSRLIGCLVTTCWNSCHDMTKFWCSKNTKSFMGNHMSHNNKHQWEYVLSKKTATYIYQFIVAGRINFANILGTIGQDSRSKCFQVQPISCMLISFIFPLFSKSVFYIIIPLNLNRSFLKLNRSICN